MYAPYCIAIVVLLVVLMAVWIYPGGVSKEGLGRRFHNDRNWPTTAYYWHRAQWPDRALRSRASGWRAPDMRWWRHPGFAAPLELSLPLHNFQEYLYGYPPASRMPFNA
jgi:hypothetical protein